MKDIHQQIQEILLEMMTARQEVNFYLKANMEIMNLAKKELDDYDEKYASKIEEADEKEKFEMKMELHKGHTILKALDKLSTLIKREVDKSKRRDNELSEQLKQFCKRHQIDWNQYISNNEEQDS